MTQDDIDAVARDLLQHWLDAHLGAPTSPDTRARVLWAIARVAEEMAEQEIAQLPPWDG